MLSSLIAICLHLIMSSVVLLPGLFHVYHLFQMITMQVGGANTRNLKRVNRLMEMSTLNIGTISNLNLGTMSDHIHVRTCAD